MTKYRWIGEMVSLLVIFFPKKTPVLFHVMEVTLLKAFLASFSN